MSDAASISLIVPVYEEEYDIVPSIDAMVQRLHDLCASGALENYEIIVFLSDKKYECLPDRLTDHEKIVFLYRGRNNKLGDMFQRGVRFAQKKFVGLITPYNQVELGILENVCKALSNYDVVVAYIGNHEARPWYRTAASLANVALVNLLFNLDLKYYHLNFYRTAAAKEVKITTDSHAAMVEAAVWLAKSGASITQVPFTMIPHSFKSKSHAFALDNVKDILKTYTRLFWHVMILRKRIDLTFSNQ